MGRFKEVLKASGGFVASLFGLDKWSKSENAEVLKDDVNEIFESLGARHPFQTKKDKEKAERIAKEKERQDMSELAQNSKKMTELLAQIERKI